MRRCAPGARPWTTLSPRSSAGCDDSRPPAGRCSPGEPVQRGHPARAPFGSGQGWCDGAISGRNPVVQDQGSTGALGTHSRVSLPGLPRPRGGSQRQPSIAPLRRSEALEERIRLRNTSTEMIMGMQRIDIPLIASTAAREVLANALVHRSYADLGPVTVQFTETLTVASPGGFPARSPSTTFLSRAVLAASPSPSPLSARVWLIAGARASTRCSPRNSSRSRRPGLQQEHERERGGNNPHTGRSDLDLVRFVLNYEDSIQQSLSSTTSDSFTTCVLSAPAQRASWPMTFTSRWGPLAL